jgi:hypothetical protein
LLAVGVCVRGPEDAPPYRREVLMHGEFRKGGGGAGRHRQENFDHQTTVPMSSCSISIIGDIWR